MSATGGLREQLARLAHQAAKESGQLARRAVEQGREAAGTLQGRASTAVSRLGEAMFTEITVPVYLLPTGGRADEYYPHFDFTTSLDELGRGTLVRPCLEVWSGRSDLDRVLLGKRLADSFSLQAREERARRVALETEQESRKESEATAIQRSSARGMKAGAAGLATSAAAIALISNPAFDLLFLVLAVSALFSGSDSGIKYFRAGLDAIRYGWKREQKARLLEADLRSRMSEMQRALSRVEVRLHPRLMRLAADLADLESAPPPPLEEGRTEAPAVESALADARYRQALPSWALPLLA